MIIAENLTKVFRMSGDPKTVLKNVNVVFPSGVSVALMGRNGAGKSTFMNIISGTMEPTSGRLYSTGTISWPVGFAGSFHPELTGSQNVRFLARIYGVDTDELADYVQDFAELGRNFHEPFKTYSSGMRARLTFGASMGISFDTYLVDEVTAVGDAAFKRKSTAVFNDRMASAGALVVSHSIGQLRSMCKSGAVLENGVMTYFDDLEEAIAFHMENMEKAPPE